MFGVKLKRKLCFFQMKATCDCQFLSLFEIKQENEDSQWTAAGLLGSGGLTDEVQVKLKTLESEAITHIREYYFLPE